MKVGILIALLSGVLIGCNKGESGIATVDGAPISKEEFYEYVMRKPTVRVQTANGATSANVAGSLGLQGLNDVVNRQLLLQMAKEENVFPSENDVAAEIQFREKQSKGFVNRLTSEGIPLKAIRQDIQIELARFNLLTKGVKVTDAEVEKYVADNPKEFVEPERAELRWIFVPTPELRNQAQAELNKGQLFATVASQYSTAPNARQAAGRFPLVNVADFDNAFPGLTKMVRATPERQATAWVPANAGFAKFYVERKIAEKKIQMTDTRRELVRRFIMIRRGSAATDLEERLIKRLKQAKIDVKVPELSKAWEKAFEALVSSDKDETAKAGMQSSVPTPKANEPESSTGN